MFNSKSTNISIKNKWRTYFTIDIACCTILENHRNLKINILYSEDPLNWINVIGNTKVLKYSVVYSDVYSVPEKVNQLLYLNSYSKSNPNFETTIENINYYLGTYVFVLFL